MVVFGSGPSDTRGTSDTYGLTPAARMTAAERKWFRIASWVPYVLLGLLAGYTVGAKHAEPGSMAIDLGLCAAAAAWILIMFTTRPAWRARPRPMAVFVVGFLALLAVLVVRDPAFGFLTIAGYFFAFSLLVWPYDLVGVFVVAVLAATAQTSGVSRTTVGGILIWVVVIVLNAVPLCGLCWIGHRQDAHNEERERVLVALGDANRKLEATLAENAGLHQQLLAQAREAGVLDERQRLAGEIHDTLAQGLTGIITQLQAADHADGDPARRRRHLDAALRLARESLTDARRSVHALRPQPLEHGHLDDALTEVAQQWSALHGTPVQITTTGTPRPLLPEAEVALLRTAQEALANVAKHAAASRVGVTLSYLDADVALDIRDDGRGFDGTAGADGGPLKEGGLTADGRPDGGFGLTLMRRRIEQLAGTLQIESEPGTGTAISAQIPAKVAP